MRQSRKLWTVLCICLLMTVMLGGCAKKRPVTTTTLPSTSTSESVDSTTGTSSADGSGESITSPVTGTQLRTALMDAARAKLNTTSQFVVYQIYVQGDYAIGDLETSPGGKRQFVAFKGPEWQALWVAPYGSGGATAASVKTAVPGISSALVAKIDWAYKKPLSDDAMAASLSAEAKKWAKTLMEGLGEPYNIAMVRVAKDSTGAWWGRVVVQPSSDASASYEPIDFWCRYSGGTWTGSAQDPEPPAPGTFFPADVAGSLGF